MSETRHESWRLLTTLERAVLRSESLGGCMVFTVEVDFDGPMEADLFGQAVHFALHYHPLLRCVIDRSGKTLTWQDVPSDNAFQQRRVAQLSTPCAEAIEPIDLQNSAGVSVALTTSDDQRTRIVWHFHHACTDGQGAGRFLRDIGTAYAMLVEGKTPKISLEPHLLVNRGRSETPAGQPPIGLVEGLRNFWVTVRGRTARFPKLKSVDDLWSTKTLVTEQKLSQALSSRIHELLRQQHLVLNDFAVAASFLMLAGTELRTSKNHYLTILNPVDLRTWADRRMPAANRVGFAFLRRRVKDWRCTKNLVESVAEQMQYVRQRGVGAEFMKGVALTDNLPPIQSVLLQAGCFIPTITVTCLSNFSVGKRQGFSTAEEGWKLGQGVVERISGAAPLPFQVPLAVAVFDSGGKIRVTMRGSAQHFNDAMIDQLIGQWISGCESICQSDL